VNRYLYTLFIFLILSGMAGRLHAQMIKEVHQNRNDYFLDITSILQYTNNKDYLAKGEALLEEFAGVWESGYFKEHHRSKVYEISNSMLSKGMRSYPHFYDFVSCMVHFVRTKQSDESFETWLVELDTLGVTRSTRPIADFLEYSLLLFDEHTLFETRSRAWYFRNGKFSFAYDSLLYIEFPELDLVC